MAETMKVFGSRPDSATMVEGDRVEFRRIFAIKQDDGNIKLFDLSSTGTHRLRCSSS